DTRPAQLAAATALGTGIVFGSFVNIVSDFRTIPPPRPVTELFYQRAAIRNLAEDRPLVVDRGRCSVQVYSWIVALTLKRAQLIQLPNDFGAEPALVISCKDKLERQDLRPVMTVGGVHFYTSGN